MNSTESLSVSGRKPRGLPSRSSCIASAVKIAEALLDCPSGQSRLADIVVAASDETHRQRTDQPKVLADIPKALPQAGGLRRKASESLGRTLVPTDAPIQRQKYLEQDFALLRATID